MEVSLLQESEQKPVEQKELLEATNQKNLLKPTNSFLFSVQPQSEQNLPQQFGTLNDYSIQPVVQGKSEEKALEKSSKPLSALLAKNKESHQQDRIEVFQQTSFQPADGKSTLHKLDTIGNPVFEVPVRATHLNKDVSFVLQNAIHVQKAKDSLEATFSLQPQHLGKVDVKVSIKDGNVTAEFFASTPSGKNLLEANVQALRTALEHQGFQVDKIDISQQNTNFSGPFSQKGESQQRQGQQDSKKRNGHGGYKQEEDYRDFSADIGWVSQINTTA
jgi:flagellar hook-length control protein FliK